MSLALRLCHIEWLKTRRRSAFWVSVLAVYALLLLLVGSAYYQHRAQPGTGGMNLPSDWTGVAMMVGMIGGLLTIVTVVLLSASEKTWRTERQNVIDGLSRTQYFAGKMMLLCFVALVLWLGSIVIVSLGALLDRTVTGASGPLFDAASAKVLGGLLLRLVVVGCMAFCFSMLATGSGPALAFSLLFQMLQEPLVQLLGDRIESVRQLAPYTLAQVLPALTSPRTWGAAGGMPVPMSPTSTLSASAALITALLYATTFSAIAWLSIRRRDL